MDRLIVLLKAILFALITALVMSVAIGVFYRYVLHHSLFWATEVPNFLFVWIVFLGAVCAYHDKKHIAFTALLDRFPKFKYKAEILVHLLILCFALFIVITGSTVVRITLDSPSEALKMPLGYLYSILPLAFSIIAIDSAVSIWKLLHNSMNRGEQ